MRDNIVTTPNFKWYFTFVTVKLCADKIKTRTKEKNNLDWYLHHRESVASASATQSTASLHQRRDFKN